jgi:hypothetical protein
MIERKLNVAKLPQLMNSVYFSEIEITIFMSSIALSFKH